jgi:hypothetical protein
MQARVSRGFRPRKFFHTALRCHTGIQSFSGNVILISSPLTSIYMGKADMLSFLSGKVSIKASNDIVELLIKHGAHK